MIIIHYCARYQRKKTSKRKKKWREEERRNIFQTPQELILLRLLDFFFRYNPPSRKKVRNPACWDRGIEGTDRVKNTEADLPRRNVNRDEIFARAAQPVLANFVLLFVLEKKKRRKKGKLLSRNNRSPLLNDSRVLSRGQFLQPTLFLPSRLLTSRETTRHPRSYRKVFAVLGGSDGSSIVAGWSVGNVERSARNVNTNITIYRRSIEKGDSQGVFQGEEKGGGKGGEAR